MLRRAAVLRIRAVATIFGWLPLIFDALESGDLLFVMPGAGLLAGILPVRWFPVVGTAQVGAAVATSLMAPRRTWSNSWLFYLAFGLSLLLNLALWLRSRRSRAEASPAARARDSIS